MDFDLIGRAAEIGSQKLEAVGGDPMKLSEGDRPIAILITVQGMIDNGGFRHIFESVFRFEPPYSLFSQAYRKIGAYAAADKLDEAVALFPFRNPEKDVEARIEFMDTLDDSHQLFKLGNKVCGDKQIWQLLETYLLQHPEAFQL